MDRSADDEASVQTTLPTNFFDAAVTEYYVVGHGNSYDKHVYAIAVSADGLQYSVERSYVDFVDLDRKLRKKFPRIKFPVLPLEASAAVAKVLAKEAARSDKRRNSAGNGVSPIKQPLRESLQSLKEESSSQLSKGLRLLEGDRISDDKVAALNKYLKQILSLHEVLASEEILLFLDEEASSMSIDPNTLEPISAHDLLLINEPLNSVVVSRIEEVVFQVRPGQLVVWRFTTDKYDIGFSIEMCGAVKVSYTRYNSHIRPAMGTVEAPSAGFCKLKWDNTYAKFRSKQLYWTARVVSAEEFHTAMLQALEVQREKKKFQTQRYTLKRVCIRNAAKHSGVIHSTDVVHEHAEEEGMHIRDMEDEIARLQQEVDGLHSDLEAALEDIEQLETAKAAADESRDQISGSWRFTATQLDNAQTELKLLRKELSDNADIKKEMKQELDKLRKELRLAQDLLAFNEESEKKSAITCMQALEAADAKIASLEYQLAKEREENSERNQQEFSSNKEMTEKLVQQATEAANAEIAQLTGKLVAVQTEFDAKEVLHGSELHAIVDECVQHKNMIIGLNAELAVFRSSNERLRAQVSEMENVIAHHAHATSSSAANKAAVESDLAALLAQLTSEREEAEDLRQQISSMSHDIERLTNDIFESQDANTVLTIHLNDARKAEQAANSSLEEVSRQLEQLSEEKAFLELSSREQVAASALSVQELILANEAAKQLISKLQDDLSSSQEQLGRSKTIFMESVQAQALAEAQAQAQEKTLEELRSRCHELEKQCAHHEQRMREESLATLEGTKEEWLVERARLEQEWRQSTVDQLNSKEIQLRQEFEANLEELRQHQLELKKTAESEWQVVEQNRIHSELQSQLSLQNDEWRNTEIARIEDLLRKEAAIKNDIWREQETKRISELLQQQSVNESGNEPNQVISPVAASAPSGSFVFPSSVGDHVSTQPMNPQDGTPGGTSAMAAVTRTPPRGGIADSRAMSASSNLNSECIKLTTMLRAKEGQLAVTMQLYDEQTVLVADLTAEVSDLKRKLSEHSEEQQEKLKRLESAMSEISSSIAFWLS